MGKEKQKQRLTDEIQDVSRAESLFNETFHARVLCKGGYIKMHRLHIDEEAGPMMANYAREEAQP